MWTNPSSTAKKCSATEDCCRNPGGDRRPSSTVKYCSATGLLPNRQRGERPGVNGLPFSHRRKETPVFNNLDMLVNRRLRQNRRKRDKPVFNSYLELLVNLEPLSHRRKETPVFNNLDLLVNRRLRQNPKERDARLQQLRPAREQTIAPESTEERQTRLQQLDLLVNRRLRQNRRNRDKPVFNS